jgi:hypothetical protein
MARYLTLHSMACLTRQGAEALARRLEAAEGVRAARVAASMVEGKLLVEFEAESKEQLAAWLARDGFHYDLLVRLEYEWRGGRLELL